MARQKVSVKQVVSRAGAVELLESLIRGLESGAIVVGEVDGSLQLSVADELDVELKGKVKRSKAKVSLSISWQQEADVPATRAEAVVPAEKGESKTPARQAKGK